MIQFRSIRQFDRLPPARKLIALLIAMAGRDGATSLRFDHYPDSRIDVWYFVGGVPYQLVPPPCSVWPLMVREFHHHVRFGRPGRGPWRRWFGGAQAFPEMPAAGRLSVRLGAFKSSADIVLFRGRNGEHAEIVTTAPDLRAGASWFYREWARHRRNEWLVEFPDPEGPN